MLSKDDLINKNVVFDSYSRIENIISFCSFITILSILVVIFFIGFSFPLEEKVVKNIIFKEKSNSTYKVIADSQIKNKVLTNLFKTYIYQREIYPIENKNNTFLGLFEIENVYKKRIEHQKKVENAAKQFLRFKRNIKIENINFLVNNSLTAKITLEDIMQGDIKKSIQTQKYQILLKFKYYNQIVKGTQKYINPLGIKIINYEIVKL